MSTGFRNRLSAVIACVMLAGLVFATTALATDITTYDQTDTGTYPPFQITYTNTWTTYSPPSGNPNFYGGSYTYASVPTRSVTVKFYGTKLDWKTIKYSNSGIAAVTLDGVPQPNVDLYAPNPGGTIQPQVVWSTGVLQNGEHTVVITPTGTHNPASGAAIVGLDSFDVSTEQPVTITATRNNNFGTITPAGATTIEYDSSQSYTITPSYYYYIKDVKVDGASVGPVSSYTFSTVQSNHTIEAIFAEKAPFVSVSASGPWTVVLLFGMVGAGLVYGGHLTRKRMNRV